MKEEIINKDIEFSIERIGEETIIRGDFSNSSYVPSIEDSPFTMAKVIEKIAEITGVTKIIFFQKREYEYDFQQTLLLNEIAKLYAKISREKEKFSITALDAGRCRNFADSWYNQLKDICFNLLLKDPIGALVELKRIRRREKIILDKANDDTITYCGTNYISILDYLISLLENTKLAIIRA